MKAVDKAGLEIVADDGRTTAYPHILAVCGSHSPLERINRGAFEEMESGASSHLYGGPWVAGEDEDRNPEWWLVAPPATPVRIVGKVVEPEHSSAHNLGTHVSEVRL